MIPLVVMTAAWLVFRALGLAGLILGASTWAGALRFALAVMFVVTGLAHFLPRSRPDLVRMVPPQFPRPAWLVTLTGVAEFVGAAGLLVPASARAAAYGLLVLLVAMFPANVFAARARLPVAGRVATPLVLRLPLQLAWIAALWWVAMTMPT